MKALWAVLILWTSVCLGCASLPKKEKEKAAVVRKEASLTSSSVLAQGMELLRKKDFSGLQAFLDAQEISMIQAGESTPELAQVWLIRAMSYMDEENPLYDLDKANGYLRLAQSNPSAVGTIASVLLERVQDINRQAILVGELNKQLDEAKSRATRAQEEALRCQERLRRLQSELDALRRLDEKQRSLKEIRP